MNIIKQMFETPDTPSGKKRLNNLITRLGLGKKVKGDLMKDVVSGELGGGASSEVKEWYYRINVDNFSADFYNIKGLLEMSQCYITNIFGMGGKGEVTSNPGDIQNIYADRFFAIKLVNNIPYVFLDYETHNIVHIYGDIYERNYLMAKRIQQSITMEQVRTLIDNYLIEISKEEYESLIEIPSVILGKE